MRSVLPILLLLLIGSCGEPETERPEVSNDTTDSTTQVAEADPMANVIEKIKVDPNDANLYFERAEIHLSRDSLVDAVGDIDRAIRLDSTQARFLLLKSDVHYRLNESRTSKELLEKVLAMDAENIEANLKLAEIYHVVGNFQESIKYANDALKIDVHNAKGYFIKGLNYKMIGDTATAVSSFLTAREQNDDYYEAYLQLALLYSEVSDPLAVQYFDNAIRVLPNSYDAHYGKAIFLQENGYPEDALVEYNILLKLGLNLPQIYHNIGYTHLIKLSNYEEALEGFNKALQLHPQFIQARHNRGLTYEFMGNPAKAEEDYRAVLKLDPTYTQSALGLGRILGNG